MSDSNSKQYILSIINCLTEESNLEKEAKDKEIKELKEKKIDIYFFKRSFSKFILEFAILLFYKKRRIQIKTRRANIFVKGIR